jgi:uncharacterized membrane protein (UPF0127 family)
MLALVGMNLVIVSACAAPEKQPPVGYLSIRTASGDYLFTVEIADTPQTREYGLMFRQSLPERHGMLFRFPQEDYVNFWMKNTLIPLDMVFIDKNGKVTNVAENAKPLTFDMHGSVAPVTSVLELAGGSAKRYHIAAGSITQYSATPPKMKP